MQHEIKKEQKLLDAAGNIAEPGYAKKLLWAYDRKDIKAPRWRIKEWDYYYIGNQDYGLCLTISDAGYVSSLSVSLLGFTGEPFQLNDSTLGLFPLGRLNMPSSSVAGDVTAEVGGLKMAFRNDGRSRRLSGTFRNFCKSGKTLSL